MKKVTALVLAVLILIGFSSCLKSEFGYSANAQSDILIITSSILSDADTENLSSQTSSSKLQSSSSKASSSKPQSSSSKAEASSSEEISYEPTYPELESSNPAISKPSANTVTVPEGSETGENLVWVPVNGGTKYHSKSTCSKMKDPIQVTIDTAETNGYTPCKRCY